MHLLVVSRNNSEYKSINNCILTKDGKELILCLNHSIPDSVTKISYAFSGCSSLQSIVIPDSVTVIGIRAFNGCISLQSIEIPDSVTEIGDYAFYGCTSLKSIEIPDSVTEIGDYAFYGCTSLKSIVIPNSVTKIGDWAFKDCRSLQSVVITTQEKDPDLSRGRIEYLLHELSAVSKAISLRVPIGCGYAYRHYPAFEGKFQKVIGDIDA